MKRQKRKWLYFRYAEFIYINDYATPLLRYKGKTYYCNDIEDTLWDAFGDYAEYELNIDVKYLNDAESEKLFLQYCKDNKDYIREVFEIATPIKKEEY